MSLEQTVDNLEIRYANAVTFVGTSNTMIDTTTGRIQTKGIQHNSNVITDISGPHGRVAPTLKKYPEIVFEEGKVDKNIAGRTYTQAGYTVTVSSQYDSDPEKYYPYELFNGILDTSGDLWVGLQNYSGSGNYAYTADTSIDTITVNSVDYKGDWVQIKTPYKIQLSSLNIRPQVSAASRSPKKGILVGSTDGTNWEEIYRFTNETYTTNQYTIFSGFTNTNYYNYFRLLAEELQGSAGYFALGELELYGYEEYTPAGDHSVDTTFMSRFNNPQTTGVQVLVDGATGVGTNQISGGPDPSGNQSTYVTDGKYWTLNGTLTSNLAVEANTFLEGDQPHAVSVWFNSSNLEANVSNTCVFSISDQEKLNSQNLDLQSNTWHNLTYAYQGEGGSRVTYLDGRKVAEEQAEDTFGDYPPFAMTGYSQGGYVVSASDEEPNYNAWKAFSDVNTNADAWVTDFTENRYDVSNGEATTNTPLFEGAHGDWIQIQLPYKVKLDYIFIDPRRVAHAKTPEASPGDGRIFGSTDGTNWTLITSFSDRTYGGDASNENATAEIVTTPTDTCYNYYRLQVTKRAGQNGTDKYVAIGELKLYGHRENDLVRLPDPTNVLKYPHIAFPNSDGPAGQGPNATTSIRGYVATSDDPNPTFYPIGKLFDGIFSDPAGGNTDNQARWQPATVIYANNGTDTTSGATTTLANGTTYKGNYMQLESPHKLNVTKYKIYSGTYLADYRPSKVVMLGSNTGGSDWVVLGSGETTLTYSGTNADYAATVSISNTSTYKYHRLVIRAIAAQTLPVVYQLEFYGTGVDSIPIQIGGGNIDKVANFRVYDKFIDENQALEIWDAQKDEFGRAKPQMVLQQGKLGIGTDAPQGSLSVADEPHNLEEFPPRAMTDYKTYFEGHGEFCVSSGDPDPTDAWSSTAGLGSLFDKGNTQADTHYYRTSANSFDSGAPGYYAGSNSIGGISGAWVRIDFPYRAKIQSMNILTRSDEYNGRAPRDGYLLGKNSDEDEWTIIHEWTGALYYQFIERKFTIEASKYYSSYALVATRLLSAAETDTQSTNLSRMNISEWRLFGTREQGQSVLHDGQLTLTKSLTVPRIGPALDADDTPRRDRLVVEYNTSTNPTFEGAVRDTSGRGLDGALIGGATYDATGKAFEFPNNPADNSSSVSGKDSIITHGIPGTRLNTQMTVSTWLRLDSPAQWEQIWGIGSSTTAYLHSILFVSNGALSYQSEGGGGAVNYPYTYTGWNHVTIVRNSATFNDVTFYVNGSVIGSSSTSGTGTMIQPDNIKLTIGGAITQNHYWLDGAISNFKLYDTALTAEEVKTLYDMGRCDEGHHVVNFSKTRVGIGLGDGEVPQATLDVRGDIAGPFTTFLTGDVTTSIVTSISSTSTIYPITSYTFDVPREYHVYGTKNLEIYGQIKWSGEANYAWNAMFSARVYYGSGLTSYIDSAENTSSDASTRNNGAGVIAVSHHSDFGSTIDSCIVGSRFYIPNCPVSNGSQLKLELRFRQGNSTASLYTNRTQADNTGDTNYERGTTNFFLVVK